MMTPIDLEELKRMLPQLVKEDDALKGAIITALSGVVATKEDIHETNRNFNRRFEALQQEMNQRFEALLLEMNHRFEKMDQRFEKMDQRFEKLETQMEIGFAALRESIKILNVSINRIESKEGQLIENVILGILRESFQLENIDPDLIEKKTLVDKSGEIFFPNYRTDIDIVVRNGDIYTFEIKSKVDHHDIAHYLQNIRLYEHISGKKVTRAYLVALRMNSNSYELAMNQGLKIIKGNITDNY